MDVATLPVRAQHAVQDFENVEDYLRAYLADERFKSTYLRASELWSHAASTLYREGSKGEVLVAARKAREAMREFASALAEPHEPSSPDSTTAEADHLSSLIDAYRPRFGDSRCDLLQSLFQYWRVLDGVANGHGRDSRGGGEPLRWEDGRRIVVLTALVMVEVDRSF